MNLQVYTYNNQQVAFNLHGENVMVNATEMAKIFSERPSNFLRLASTKAFIKAFKAVPEVVQLSNETVAEMLQPGGGDVADLLHLDHGNGTWMHRVLALKFAAWLNPDFEVWVYQTIDKILFGELHLYQQTLRKSAIARRRMDELRQQMRQENALYRELEQIQSDEKRNSRLRSQILRTRMQLLK